MRQRQTKQRLVETRKAMSVETDNRGVVLNRAKRQRQHKASEWWSKVRASYPRVVKADDSGAK